MYQINEWASGFISRTISCMQTCSLRLKITYISILATFDNRKLFKTVYYWEVKQMHEVTVKIKPFDRNTVM